jgi:hypothetical protein
LPIGRPRRTVLVRFRYECGDRPSAPETDGLELVHPPGLDLVAGKFWLPWLVAEVMIAAMTIARFSERKAMAAWLSAVSSLW